MSTLEKKCCHVCLSSSPRCLSVLCQTNQCSFSLRRPQLYHGLGLPWFNTSERGEKAPIHLTRNFVRMDLVFFFSGLLLISPSGWRTHYVRWEIPHRLVWVSWLVRSSILYFIQKLALDAPYDGGAPRFSWGFSSRTIKTLPQKLICLENTETGTNTGWAMPLIWVYNENHAINNQFRSILDAFLSTCIYLQKLKKNGNIRKRLPTRATMGIHHILKFPTFGG